MVFLLLARQFFQWSLRQPSGGLLNVIFTPEDGGLFRMNSQKEIISELGKFLQFVIFNTTTDLPVLKNQSVQQNARTNPNREGVIIWPRFGLLLFSSVLLIIFGWRFNQNQVRSL